MKKNRPYLFFDANHLSWRSYHLLGKKMGIGKHRDVCNSICYGFINTFMNLMKQFKGKKIIVCWDSPPYFRHQIYKDYKGQRPAKDDRFIGAMILCKQMLKDIGILQLAIDGLEADDLAGIFTFLLSKKKEHSLIVTDDKDYFQLLRKRIKLYRPNRNEIYEVKNFKTEYEGLKPKDSILLKSISGDRGDNIIGINRVGEKTTLKVMSQFKTLKEILANKKKVKEIRGCKDFFKGDNIDRVRLNKILVTIPNSDRGIDKLVKQGYISKKQIKNIMKQFSKIIEIKRKKLSRILGEYGLRKFKRQVIKKDKNMGELLGLEII